MSILEGIHSRGYSFTSIPLSTAGEIYVRVENWFAIHLNSIECMLLDTEGELWAVCLKLSCRSISENGILLAHQSVSTIMGSQIFSLLGISDSIFPSRLKKKKSVKERVSISTTLGL